MAAREVIDHDLLDQVAADLTTAIDRRRGGVRNLLEVAPSVRALACLPVVRALPEEVLGRECFVTKATLFDKTPGANWKVAWHQDLTIAVANRSEAAGFGPW